MVLCGNNACLLISLLRGLLKSFTDFLCGKLKLIVGNSYSLLFHFADKHPSLFLVYPCSQGELTCLLLGFLASQEALTLTELK